MMHLTIQQLVAQTDGELTGPSLTLVEKHIAECETCWHEMERLAEMDALLASIITADPGDAFFEDLAVSVEAVISGKKKPASRPAAPPMPAPPPAPVSIQRPERWAAPPAPVTPIPEPEAMLPAPAMPGPEPEATAPAPAMPSPEPEAAPSSAEIPSPELEAAAPETELPSRGAPSPMPVPSLDTPVANPPADLTVEPVGGWTPPAPRKRGNMAVEHGGAWTPPALPAPEPKPLTIEPVGAWSPPTPTPDDPFADLVLPPRSTVAPASKPAPKPPSKPVTVTPPPAPVAPRPAPKPASKPVTVTPPPAPVPPRPALKPLAKPVVATPAPPAAPQPRVEPGSPYERRRPSLAVPILIGVLAFIAGLVVAVVVVIRLAGPGGILNPRQPGAPSTAQPVDAQPPAPAASTEPAPPPAPPTRNVEPRPPSAPAHAAARPRRQAPPATASPADNAALNAQPTIVIPVQVTRSEAVAPVSPPATEPAPAAPAPAAEPGILCGAVLDSDEHPVARAQVMMADVGVVVLTDRAGRFCLTAPAGERTLSVVALGFTTARRLVSLGKRTPEIVVKLNSAAPFPTPK